MTSRAEKNRPAFIIENRTPKLAKRNRRKNRPMDPAEIARRLAEQRRNPALWGTNDEALKLAANADVQVAAESRKNERRVQRFDVFGLLFSRKELDLGSLQAVRRLQSDIAILHRTQGQSGTGILGQKTNTAPDFAKARILAGQRITEVSEKTGALSWAILEAVSEPPMVTGEQPNWRAIVSRVAGENNHMAQSALVKMAAANLAGAYSSIDHSERKRA
jgi:hypothetical protein